MGSGFFMTNLALFFNNINNRFDFFILIFLYRRKKGKSEEHGPIKKRYAIGTLVTAFALFMANLGLAEIDRPQLLTRTFDRNYIVKYFE